MQCTHDMVDKAFRDKVRDEICNDVIIRANSLSFLGQRIGPQILDPQCKLNMGLYFITFLWVGLFEGIRSFSHIREDKSLFTYMIMIIIYQICLSTKFSQLKNRSVSTFLFSTTIIFLPLLLDKKLVTIQLKVKELCYNYNNYIIYILQDNKTLLLFVDISFNTTWLTGQWILLYYIDHIYYLEKKWKKKMNCEIPNCVFGACFAHKKYTKQSNSF